MKKMTKGGRRREGTLQHSPRPPPPPRLPSFLARLILTLPLLPPPPMGKFRRGRRHRSPPRPLLLPRTANRCARRRWQEEKARKAEREKEALPRDRERGGRRKAPARRPRVSPSGLSATANRGRGMIGRRVGALLWGQHLSFPFSSGRRREDRCRLSPISKGTVTQLLRRHHRPQSSSSSLQAQQSGFTVQVQAPESAQPASKRGRRRGGKVVKNTISTTTDDDEATIDCGGVDDEGGDAFTTLQALQK